MEDFNSWDEGRREPAGRGHAYTQIHGISQPIVIQLLSEANVRNQIHIWPI